MAISLLNDTHRSVYSCLCYFDVFGHPLLLSEVCAFSSIVVSENEARLVLDDLITDGMVCKIEGYYQLNNAPAFNVRKRREAEARFEKKRKTISRFARLVARFPFVEAVAISGSCSKGLLEPDGDVDYFIVTRPGRLWLCRSLLITFKKLILLNSKKYFCVNYFLSSDHLEIPDHNAFVACEISTLKPVNNLALFQKFQNQNTWVKNFLPNKSGHDPLFLNEKPAFRPLAGLVEWFLKGRMGAWLDKQLFQFTLNTWEKKFPDFSKEEFDLNLRSKKNVSKHHPRGFQKKVLQEFEHRLAVLNLMVPE